MLHYNLCKKGLIITRTQLCLDSVTNLHTRFDQQKSPKPSNEYLRTKRKKLSGSLASIMIYFDETLLILIDRNFQNPALSIKKQGMKAYAISQMSHTLQKNIFTSRANRSFTTWLKNRIIPRISECLIRTENRATDLPKCSFTDKNIKSSTGRRLLQFHHLIKKPLPYYPNGSVESRTVLTFKRFRRRANKLAQILHPSQVYANCGNTRDKKS